MQRFERAENPRRKRRSGRRSRGRRRNPGRTSRFSARGVFSHLKSGFTMGAVKEALPLAGGALLNYYAAEKLGEHVPQVASGLPGYAAGVALAGLSSLVPKYGPKLFVGGMVYQSLKAINEYVMPGVLKLGDLIEGGASGGSLVTPQMPRMNRMGDLIAPRQLGESVEVDTPIGEVGELVGMGGMY